jgi:hypothetical protein
VGGAIKDLRVILGPGVGPKEGVHNVHTLGFGSGRVMSRDMGDGFVSGDR